MRVVLSHEWMKSMRTRRMLAYVLAAAAIGCANPKAEANTAQALNDAANEIGGLKNDLVDLQTQMDSLKATVARQDTLISRIMAVSNIPK